MLYSQYQFATGNLARLLDIEIGNPINCMLGIVNASASAKSWPMKPRNNLRRKMATSPVRLTIFTTACRRSYSWWPVAGPAAQKLSKPKKPSPAPYRYAGRSTTFPEILNGEGGDTMPLSSSIRYAIEVVDTSGLSEEDWLGYRRQGIGGSDVAAIMGVPHLPPCGICTTINAATRMLSRRKTTG